MFKNISADACVCRLRGDPLLETYDGNFFQLIGTKKYLLTKWIHENDECSFNVEAKAGELEGGKITYPRYLDVMIMGLKIRMEQDGKVIVGGKEITLPNDSLKAGLSITNNGDFIIVDTTPTCGVKIGFNGEGLQSVATIIASADYAEQEPGLQGLCGECDGTPDDLKTAAGEDMTNDPDKNRKISDSYVVDESDDQKFKR
jgi:hypothetical protein